MKEKITILSTKKLKAAVLDMASWSGLGIRDIDFIKILPVIGPPQAEAISHSRQHLVFTSANAVKYFSRNMEEFGMETPARHVFCLQGETMNEVHRLRNMEVIAAAKDAAALAQLICRQREIEAVSFVCGNKRRNEILAILKQHEIAVEEIEVYKTISNSQPVTGKFSAVLFFSPSAAEAFFQANILRGGIPCFCVGDSTAAAVREFTGNVIIAANEPRQEEVINCVLKYFNLK